jgi:hypothetical protein
MEFQGEGERRGRRVIESIADLPFIHVSMSNEAEPSAQETQRGDGNGSRPSPFDAKMRYPLRGEGPWQAPARSFQDTPWDKLPGHQAEALVFADK